MKLQDICDNCKPRAHGVILVDDPHNPHCSDCGRDLNPFKSPTGGIIESIEESGEYGRKIKFREDN
jgi:hypothetical protein